MLGEVIRIIRVANDMTGSALSEKSGVSISYINEIEKGKKAPSPDILNKLAIALDLSQEELLEFDELHNKLLKSKDKLSVYRILLISILEFYKSKEEQKSTGVLAYDCDGYELYEFDIVRAVWYSDIDFKTETDVDPRQYCIVKALDGNPYLISVYDWCNKEAINRFEGRSIDSSVPIKIRPITDAENYEMAVDSYDDKVTCNSPYGQAELKKTLNKKIVK